MKNILSIFVLIFTFTGFASAECSDADKKALEAFDRAWGEAGEKGDKAALIAILADDYAGLPGLQNKSQNIEAALKAAEQDKANPSMADKISHDNYIITCTPMTAVITHRNIVVSKDSEGGKEKTSWTRSVHMLEKRGGKWQVVGNAGNSMDEYAKLGYMELDWNNADVARDATWFEKNFAADYSSISSRDAKIANKSEDIAGFKNDKSRTEWNHLSEMDIRIEGNMAVVTGVNHVKGKDDKGAAFDLRVRFTDTFIKRDGRWQVWATQGTRIP
jgi:ketosteroid isomerase-like protein